LETLGIEDRPEPLTRLQKQATVLHLVKSISGINHAAAGESPSMTAEKRRRLGSARDLARFGQIYLNKGMCNGRQIIPAAWIRPYTIQGRNAECPPT
jgi:hypothetical protein